MQGVLGKYGQLPAGGGGGSSALAPGAWSPVTLTNGDGDAITLGQVCYLSANDTARKGQADGTFDEANIACICLDASIAAGVTGSFAFGGIVTGLAGLVAGDFMYLSATLGTMQVAPILTIGQYSVLLGRCQSASKFQFNPQIPILN